MSKPQTKGASISLRLPLSVDRAVRTRAAEQNETPAAWITRQIVGMTRPKQASPVREPAAVDTKARNGKPSFQVSDCRHIDVMRHQTGMWICKGCTATSKDRGQTWQVAAP
jgi:ribosomal protein L37AE/L43A